LTHSDTQISVGDDKPVSHDTDTQTNTHTHTHTHKHTDTAISHR